MTTEDIFLGSQASLTLIPEVDLYIPINHSNSTSTSLEAHNDWEAHFLMVNNLYVGCIVEFYDADATDGTTDVQSTHVVTSNTHNTIVISPAISITLADGDFIHIRGYGAPCVGAKNTNTKRLNADNWIGTFRKCYFP